MLTFLSQPWPWYASGTVIALVMAILLFFGKSFGFSSNLRAICAACGAGKQVPFFDFNWRAQTWNLLFLVGAIIGGFISSEFLSDGTAVQISQAQQYRSRRQPYRTWAGLAWLPRMPCSRRRFSASKRCYR